MQCSILKYTLKLRPCGVSRTILLLHLKFYNFSRKLETLRSCSPELSLIRCETTTTTKLMRAGLTSDTVVKQTEKWLITVAVRYKEQKGILR